MKGANKSTSDGLSSAAQAKIEEVCSSNRNGLIVGGTGAGKTNTLNCIYEILANENSDTVTIEVGEAL